MKMNTTKARLLHDLKMELPAMQMLTRRLAVLKEKRREERNPQLEEDRSEAALQMAIAVSAMAKAIEWLTEDDTAKARQGR